MPGKKLQISWTLLKTVSFSNKITLNRAISSSSDESIFQMNYKFVALMISSMNVRT